jgi:hypothetical protein
MRTFILTAWALFQSSVTIAADLAPAPTATFDQVTQNNVISRASVDPGDSIVVLIKRTCPDRFDYQYTALYDAVDTTQSGGASVADASCKLDDAKKALASSGYCSFADQTVSFIHDKKASGYEIRVTKKEAGQKNIWGLKPDDFNTAAQELVGGGVPCAVEKKVEDELAKKRSALDNASYQVMVASSPWALVMSGGLTISKVTDPRFAVVTDSSSKTTPPGKIVIRDRSAEDSQRLGFAGFLHLHNQAWNFGDIALAGTAGFGIDEKSSISGFLGVSAAAWDNAYLTVGWNWRSVDRLPAGQSLGAAPISDNVLSSLPTRTASGFFIGISYKLMSPGESFFKSKTTQTPKPAETPAAVAPKR